MKKILNCACLIHGDYYNIEYVDKLYNSIKRNISLEINLHVYTEKSRKIKKEYIKHELEDYPGVGGKKSGWWYKIQLFNANLYSGDILYFDLDLLIIKNIDWIWELYECNKDKFIACKDFKYLFGYESYVNSSIMMFDVKKYKYIYDNFKLKYTNIFLGDQDYINAFVKEKVVYLDEKRIKSYTYEVLNKFKKSKKEFNIENTDIIVFHGKDKPHILKNDNLVKEYWK
jgi:hypothetical protein